MSLWRVTYGGHGSYRVIAASVEEARAAFAAVYPREVIESITPSLFGGAVA